MAIFEWKSEYETGVDEIDYQHRVLVSLINELSDLASNQFDLEAAGEVFEKLKSYTVFHFATEEELMGQYRYEERDHQAHLLQHRQFEKEIESVQQDFNQVSVEDCNVILSYLKNWLINHIGRTDKRLAAVILAKRRAEPVPKSSDSSGHSLPQNDDTVGQWHPFNDEIERERYLAIARDQMTGVEVMLHELETCLGELREYCDELARAEPRRASDNAYMQCVQGTYLVKSLQGKQIKLKEALSILAQEEL